MEYDINHKNKSLKQDKNNYLRRVKLNQMIKRIFKVIACVALSFLLIPILIVFTIVWVATSKHSPGKVIEAYLNLISEN